MMVSSTGNDKIFFQLNTYLPRLSRHLFTNNYRKSSAKMICVKNNEAFKDASQIQYVARAGDYKAKGFESTGYLNVLKVILNYDYLWINVRVQGGAYGCMASFKRNGMASFVSYRDPNLRKTNDVFENMGEYIRNFDANERDMTKFVIGAISTLDMPLTPSQRGKRGLDAYMKGVDDSALQKERDEVLSTSVEDIRNQADLIDAVMGQKCLCVIGNEDNIEANADMFDSINQLM